MQTLIVYYKSEVTRDRFKTENAELLAAYQVFYVHNHDTSGVHLEFAPGVFQ